MKNYVLGFSSGAGTVGFAALLNADMPLMTGLCFLAMVGSMYLSYFIDKKVDHE